jgi:fatty acid/phospholipid biosynthesis enzyme
LLKPGGQIGVVELLSAAPASAVIITDGFSGNVLREAFDLVRGLGFPVTGVPVAGRCTPRGGGVVLGLEGDVVVGRADSVAAYADAVDVAARVHRKHLVSETTRTLADLVAWRRMSVGLNPVSS